MNDPTTTMFVSYVWDDRQQHVRAMVKFLHTVGSLKILIDSDRLADGDFSQQQPFLPTDDIDSADVVLLFLSNNFKKSRYCRRIATYAFKQAKLIFPVLLETEQDGFVVDGWLATAVSTHIYPIEDAIAYPTDGQLQIIVNDLLLRLARRLAAIKRGDSVFNSIDRTVLDFPEDIEESKPPQITFREPTESIIRSEPSPIVSLELPSIEICTIRGVKIFISYPPDTPPYRLADVEGIIAFLATSGFILTYPAQSRVEAKMAYCAADLILAFGKWFAFNDCSANKKTVLVDYLGITMNEEPQEDRNIHNNRSITSKYALGEQPLTVIIEDLLEDIGQLLTIKCNVPKLSCVYYKRIMEEQLLKTNLKQLCTSPNEVYLTVNGEHGVGKTTLVSQVLTDKGNSSYLACDCGIENIVWLNASKFCAQRTFNENKLFENLTEAFESEYGTIYPKTRFNLGTLFASERRNYGKLLIVLDDYANHATNAPILEALQKLGTLMKCVVICSPDGDTSQPLIDSDEKVLSRQSSITINQMMEPQIQKMLDPSFEWKVGHSGAAILTKLCFGLPLLVRMIEGNFAITTTWPGNTDRSTVQEEKAVNYCDWLANELEQHQSQQRSTAIWQICSKLFGWSFEENEQRDAHFYDNRTNAALQAYSAFLCFAPGQPVDVRDLATIWKCETNSADSLCHFFVKRGLLSWGHHTMGVATSYAVNGLVYKTALDYTLKTRHLFSTMSEIFDATFATPDVAVLAVKNHREELLRRILVEHSSQVLDTIARFRVNGDEGSTFCDVLASEHWHQYEGCRFERNISAEMMSLLIDGLSKEGIIDVVEILALTSKETGECALLQLTEATDDGTKEFAKLKKQLNALLSASGKKLLREALVEKRRWLNEARDGRNSRLFTGAIRNDENLVRSILQVHQNANINFANRHHGETALMAASANGCLTIAQLLIEYGANLNMRSLDKMTALHYAAKNGHDQITALLLSVTGRNSVNVNAAEEHCGLTALMFAARAGHRLVVDVLRHQNQLNVNARSTNNGSTAVMMAAQKGHTQIVEDLVAIGADPVAANNDGVTALMLAAENGHLLTVNLLINFAPGNLDIPRSDGMTALNLASRAGHDQVVALLQVNGASVLQPAVGIYGRCAFHFAAQSGHGQVAETLRMVGGAEDVDMRDAGPSEATPLLLASEMGHHHVVHYLVVCGADVNAKDKASGYSAIQLAARGGFLPIVETLATHGADIHSASPISGESALHLAAMYGHEPCVDFFVKHGADINARCFAKQWTACQYAMENGHASICRYLYQQPGCEIKVEDVGLDNMLRLLTNGENENGDFFKLQNKVITTTLVNKKNRPAVRIHRVRIAEQ